MPDHRFSPLGILQQRNFPLMNPRALVPPYSSCPRVPNLPLKVIGYEPKPPTPSWVTCVHDSLFFVESGNAPAACHAPNTLYFSAFMQTALEIICDLPPINDSIFPLIISHDTELITTYNRINSVCAHTYTFLHACIWVYGRFPAYQVHARLLWFPRIRD